MPQCRICNKTFNYPYELNRHKFTHTKEKPYSCDLCDKSFSQSVNLQTHKKLHFNDFQFSCDFCNKKFVQKSNMLLHRKLHTGETPIKCDLCNKKFAQKGNMKRHRKTHSKMPNYCEFEENVIDTYSCEVCGKYFIRKGGYLNHKRMRCREKLIIPMSSLKSQSNVNKERIKLSERNCQKVKGVKKLKNVINNHFTSKEAAEINLLDNLKPLNGLNENLKVKKIYFKKGNPTIDIKVEKEEMTNKDILPEEFIKRDDCVEPTEKNIDKEEYIDEEGDLPNFNIKLELDVHCNHEMFDDEKKSTELSNFHFQTIKLTKPFPCSLCDLAFNRRLFLTKHMQLVHL